MKSLTGSCALLPLPDFAAGDFPVASSDGQRLFVFDLDGKHLRTQHALTNSSLYTFGYNSTGQLSTISDANGNVTTIAHDPGGRPTSVTAPFGQVTTLSTMPTAT